jgi:hypothetical protein
MASMSMSTPLLHLIHLPTDLCQLPISSDYRTSWSQYPLFRLPLPLIRWDEKAGLQRDAIRSQ